MKFSAARFVIAPLILALVSGTFGPAPAEPPGRQVGYVIRPGDQLALTVYGVESLSQSVVVLPDGTITMPMVGVLRAAGLSPSEVADTLRARLSRYVLNPVVSVSVARVSTINVLVLGNVLHPGRYSVDSDARVTDALAVAGGLGPTNGPPSDARVSSADGTQRTVPLNRLLRGGDVQFDFLLKTGDVVYLPSPLTFRVDVVGAVDHPGSLEINEGDRLSGAIAKAGVGANSQADLNRVKVTRPSAAGSPETFIINLYTALDAGDLSKDVVLQKGDLVYVPTIKKSSVNGATGAAYLLSALRVLFLGYR